MRFNSRMDLRTLVVLQFFCTAALTGLIWFVQRVGYPAFAAVGPAEFPAYHKAHMKRITPIVAPLMLAEIALALAFCALAPGRVAILGLILVGVVWLSTALLQVPCHRRLETGLDEETIRFLVRSNWIRTFAWTVRSILLGTLLTDWL